MRSPLRRLLARRAAAAGRGRWRTGSPGSRPTSPHCALSAASAVRVGALVSSRSLCSRAVRLRASRKLRGSHSLSKPVRYGAVDQCVDHLPVMLPDQSRGVLAMYTTASSSFGSPTSPCRRRHPGKHAGAFHPHRAEEHQGVDRLQRRWRTYVALYARTYAANWRREVAADSRWRRSRPLLELHREVGRG